MCPTIYFESVTPTNRKTYEHVIYRIALCDNLLVVFGKGDGGNNMSRVLSDLYGRSCELEQMAAPFLVLDGLVSGTRVGMGSKSYQECIGQERGNM